jgi:MFS family permease
VKDPVTGVLALNATHIALWGALYFVTCIAVQSVAPTTADRYGRKFNMWGITVFITIVSIIPKLESYSLTGLVCHHSVLLQDLVGDSYCTRNRWTRRWSNGHILYGLHV